MVQVAPALVPLARCLPGADEVITWGEDMAPTASEPAWDVQIEVMELPYVLRLQTASLPYVMGYLQLPKGPCREAERLLRVAGEVFGTGEGGWAWCGRREDGIRRDRFR